MKRTILNVYCIQSLVKLNPASCIKLVHPLLFVARDGVAPLRGFIRPALRVTRIKAHHDIEATFPLQTQAAILPLYSPP